MLILLQNKLVDEVEDNYIEMFKQVDDLLQVYYQEIHKLVVAHEVWKRFINLQ